MVPFPECPDQPFIVFEDDAVCAVFKPCGLHAAPGAGPSLFDWIVERRPEIGRVPGRGKGEGGLVHRLDSATSGLVIFAKDVSTFAAIDRFASEGLFVKRYAIRCRPAVGSIGVAGSIPIATAPSGCDQRAWTVAVPSAQPDGILELLRTLPGNSSVGDAPRASVASLFRGYGPAGARVACALPGAQSSGRTTWGRIVYETQLMEVHCEADALSLEAELTRGFRHQIRAHLAWIGLPIDGDSLYGGVTDVRLRLHACAVSFPHPHGRGVLTVAFPEQSASDSDWQYRDSTL